MELPRWLHEVPVFADWRVGRDNPLIIQNGIFMHPFMVAQLRHPGDPIAWLDTVLGVITQRVLSQAAAACRRVDQACDVDTLEPFDRGE